MSTTPSNYIPLVNGTGTLVVHGEVVRVSAANTFVRAQAEAITANIGAGSTAVVSDTAHSVLFADTDTFALVLSNAGDAGKTIAGMALLEGPV